MTRAVTKAFATLLVISVLCLPSIGQEHRKVELQEHLATDAQVSVSGPGVIKAGEIVLFIVTLDSPPSGDAQLLYKISGPKVSSTLGASVVSGQTRCEINLRTGPAWPTGTYQLHVVGVNDGLEVHPLKAEDISFQVIGNEHLDFPKSAKVTLVASQIQLLRGEAVRLQARIQELKEKTHGVVDSPALYSILRDSIRTSLDILNSTESSFTQLSARQGNDIARNTEAKSFFEDLRQSYLEVQMKMPDSKEGQEIKFKNSSWNTSDERGQPGALAVLGVLRSLEHNEAAYNYVSKHGSLTFDLTIQSIPAGATISLRRRGDTEDKHPMDKTTTTIHSLVCAVWIVHLQMDGYKDEQREYDPFTETDRLVVEFVAKTK